MFKERLDRKGGFTIVELMVAMALSLLLVAIIYGLYITYSRSVLRQEQFVEIQQVARSASDKIRDYLMQVGKNAKTGAGQPMLYYASPYQVVFNADINPDLAEPRGFTLPIEERGVSMGVTYEGVSVDYGDIDPLPPAETYRIYVSEYADGTDYSTSDLDREIRIEINGNRDEQSDYQLAYGVRWDDGSSAYQYPDGTRQKPLFLYWGDWDFNVLTPDELWGDKNHNGQLEADEIEDLVSVNGGNYDPEGDLPIGLDIPALYYGAVRLTEYSSGGKTVINTEDADLDGFLDEDEDLNSNRKLDHNLLDTQLHRVEVNITTIAQSRLRRESDPREAIIQTSVDPRNLNAMRLRDCGYPPKNISSLTVSPENCVGFKISFRPSEDDGRNENDVMYYKLMRKCEVYRNSDLLGADEDYHTFAVLPASAEPDSSGNFGSFWYNYLDMALDEYLRVGDDSENTFEGYVGGRPRKYIRCDYMVMTVDCASQYARASRSPSSGIYLFHDVNPLDHYFIAYDSPCFNRSEAGAELGSITLEWKAYNNGADSGLEYWIYRYGPFVDDAPGHLQLDEALRAEPVAKLEAKTEDSHSECGAYDSWEECPFYWEAGEEEGPIKYPKQNMGSWYFWRDQDLAPYRSGGSSMLARNGHQYGVAETGTDPTDRRYIYAIRIYDPSIGCPSTGYSRVESCYWDIESHDFTYNDLQSFNTYFGEFSNAEADTRFSPPMWGTAIWNHGYDDAATIVDNSYKTTEDEWVPQFTLYFYPSKSERCDGALPIQDYWIVRERWLRNDLTGAITYTGQRLIFDGPTKRTNYIPNSSYTWSDGYDPGGGLNSYTPDGNAAVWYSEDTCIKKPASDNPANSNSECYGNISQLPTGATWTIQYTEGQEVPKLRPHPDLYGNGSWPSQAEVNYMRNKYSSGGINDNPHYEYHYYVTPIYDHGDDTYSIGVNCPKRAPWVCFGTGSISEPYPGVAPTRVRQCDLRGPVTVEWSFIGAVPTDNRYIGSLYTRELYSGAEWEIVEKREGISSYNNGTHCRVDDTNCGSDKHHWTPGRTYEYMFRITFKDDYGDEICPMEIPLNQVTPGVPYEPYTTVEPENCVDDSLEVNIYDRADYCRDSNSDFEDTTTLEEYVWFRVHREYKYPWEGEDQWKQDEAHGSMPYWICNFPNHTCDPDINNGEDCDPMRPNHSTHHYLSCREIQVEGRRVFGIGDYHKYYADRQYRYQVRVAVDHNGNHGLEQWESNNCNVGELCDMPSPTNESQLGHVGFACLCTPHPDNQYTADWGQLSVWDFSTDPEDEYFADCVDEHSSGYYLNDPQSTLGCYFPFCSNSINFCEDEEWWCSWMPGWLQGWLGDNFFDFHMWEITKRGAYCQNGQRYCLRSKDLRSINEWAQSAWTSITRKYNSHYYTWNNLWEGSSYNHFDPAGCECGEENPVSDNFNWYTDFIMSWHTKGRKNPNWFGGGNTGFDHIHAALFRADEPSNPNTNFLDEPDTYIIMDDFGSPTSPAWWPPAWGGFTNYNVWHQRLHFRSTWSILRSLGGFCDAFPDICDFFDEPVEWIWPLYQIDGYRDDTKPIAHMMLVCNSWEFLTGPYAETQVYHVAMTDPWWVRLNHSTDLDIETALFENALRDEYSEDSLVNSFRFNAGEWRLQILIDLWFVEFTIWDVALSAEDRVGGKIGFFWVPFNWNDFLSLKSTPTYGVDNVRVRRYCGECGYCNEYNMSGDCVDYRKGPRFINEMDEDLGIFMAHPEPADKLMGTESKPALLEAQALKHGMTLRDISKDPFSFNLSAMKEDPKHTRPGVHPFAYSYDFAKKQKVNTIKVSDLYLKETMNWTDEKIRRFKAQLEELNRRGLLPLSYEKLGIKSHKYIDKTTYRP